MIFPSKSPDAGQESNQDHMIKTLVLELLASRVCHDLISPVGAINNGIEFLEEMGPEAGQEAVDLIAHSAKTASARLLAFRIGYGLGGRDPSVKPSDVKDVFDNLITLENKVTQTWDADGDIGFEERPEGFAKLLMGALLLVAECLPKGGEIVVTPGDRPNMTVVKGTGEDAAPRAHFVEALELSMTPEEIEPILVHPYVLGLLAKQYDLKVVFAAEDKGTVCVEISQ